MQLDRERDALLVIDVQPDFMPGGPLEVAGGDAVVAPIASVMERFEVVVATQDWHPAGHTSFASTHGKPPFSQIPMYGGVQVLWPDHCLQGTPGAALHPALPDRAIGMILRKGRDPRVDSYSAFRENLGPSGKREPTGLAGWLRNLGVERVFLCGLARDYCVLWSAEDAAAEGFATFVLDDLTRPVDPSRRADTDAAYDRAGARVITMAEL